MTDQCVSMSAYLLKGAENKMEWEKFSFFLKEKTDIFSSSEQMVEAYSTGQGQRDKCFYVTSKDVQTVESKLEMKSTFRYIFKIFCQA